jgi:hypothetical protein
MISPTAETHGTTSVSIPMDLHSRATPSETLILLALHSSRETQPLNILTFALLKQRFSRSNFDHAMVAQSNKIVEILGVWFAASASYHNVATFVGIGLIPWEDGGHDHFEFHPEKARRVSMAEIEIQGMPYAPLPDKVRMKIPLPTGVQGPEPAPLGNYQLQGIIRRGKQAKRMEKHKGTGNRKDSGRDRKVLGGTAGAWRTERIRGAIKKIGETRSKWGRLSSRGG